MARQTRGLVYALDIEPELIVDLQRAALSEGLTNLTAIERDFVRDGTGLPDASVDHAMLFNILHIENPAALLHEAYRVLVPGGTVSIIHWNRDPETPRGPSMTSRLLRNNVSRGPEKPAWLMANCAVSNVAP